MALATILAVAQISINRHEGHCSVNLTPEPGAYILIGAGLLIIWVLVRGASDKICIS
jgi:hypothetical protein